MKRCSVALVLVCLMNALAFAADGPPSDASIREVLDLARAKDLLESVRAQSDASMRTTIKQLTAGQTITPERQAAIDEMLSKVRSLYNETLNWESLEPMYMDIYRQSFTQHEIDGLIVFYKSESGQALITKMPIVMQKSMQEMQRRMVAIMPTVQQIVQETMAASIAKPAAP